MHLCYIDESGTPDLPGNTSHYVLVGLSIPDEYWKSHHDQLEQIKTRFGLQDAEIHTAWMMRPYLEQASIPGFESMSWTQRRSRVTQVRNAELLRLQRVACRRVKQTRKIYRNTEALQNTFTPCNFHVSPRRRSADPSVLASSMMTISTSLKLCLPVHWSRAGGHCRLCSSARNSSSSATAFCRRRSLSSGPTR